MNKTFKYQFIGMVFIIPFAIYFIVKEVSFINKNELVKAVITSIEFKKGNNDDKNDYYILSLKRLSGGTLVNDLQFDSPLIDPKYHQGQIVEVYFNSSEPDNSEIKNLWIQWEVPMILGLFCIFDLVFFGISYKVFLSKKKGEISNINSPISENKDVRVH